LGAYGLNAGGNITIQQFVGGQVSLAQQLDFFIKHIGLENIRASNFANSQFEAYCKVWKSLQALRVAGDDLWESATEDNIVIFAKCLRETYTTAGEGELFFEDRDRNDLIGILEAFGRYRLGK